MISVLVWGGTGHARVLREALLGQAEVVAVFDNRDIPSPFEGVPMHVGESGFDAWASRQGTPGIVQACVAIGGGRGRDRVDRLRWLQARGHPAITVSHARAFVASDAIFGSGCHFLAQSAICSGARLGDGVIVNTGASVDHDCVLGDGVHLAPGSRVAGEVVIGEHAFIGCGAVVLPRLKIGAGAIIGAGAVVTRDVGPNQTVVGNPARPHIQDQR